MAARRRINAVEPGALRNLADAYVGRIQIVGGSLEFPGAAIQIVRNRRLRGHRGRGGCGEDLRVIPGHPGQRRDGRR
jgi:hypothetical protein